MVLAITLMVQQASQAETATLSPQNAAVVAAGGKLQIIVDLSEQRGAKKMARLEAELLDADGKSVGKAEGMGSKERPAHFQLEIPQPKVTLNKLKLVCRWQGQKFAVPVRRVVLARAHETSLSAGQEYYAGSTAAVRCGVHSVRSYVATRPLAGARVDISLRPTEGKGKTTRVYAGKTGTDGNVLAEFPVPALPGGSYIMQVVTRSPLGEDKLERQVQIKSEAKILLVTDKPLYQPGQVMHIRALALRPFDLKPAGKADLIFEVEDAKGNKVFKQAQATSRFGVAHADFQLADEVNMGAYQIRAIMGPQQAQKTVTVKQYVLPKFKVNVTADKSFYLPKETVKAEVQTDYFFGKPVAKGKVKVTASTFDVAFKAFQTWEGTTDAAGHVKFDIKLPDYFVGQPLQKGDALVKLEVKVTDTADHTETVTRTYTVSDQAIRVSLIPEGGRILPGMENRVYAAAIYPDGTPAECTIRLWTGREAKDKPTATVKTNAAGLAEFTITPKEGQLRKGNWEVQQFEMLGGNAPQIWGQRSFFDMTAEARDQKGNVAKTVAEINSEVFGENVLLRLDKAIYQGGDTLRAEVRTSAGMPTAYLDIVKGGQTLLTRWLDVKDGKAEHRLDLPQNVFGTLEVHAYQILRSGEIIRDSRVVYVHPTNTLKIDVKAEKDVYLPGENGTIHFQVTDAAGKPTVAALGIIVVDEAVYALQEMQPGLEKVYFTLQEELMKPQAQVVFKPNENIQQLIQQPALPAPKQQIAQVLLAGVRPKPPARWEVAPAVEREQRLEGQVTQLGWALYNYATSLHEFQEVDKKSRTWRFRPALVQEMINAHYLNDAMVTDPLGSRLTLEDVTRLENQFTAERLARAVNATRMYQLAWALVNNTNANQQAWLKNGKWKLPDNVLALAIKQGLNDKWLTDVWGTPYKLIKLKKKQQHGWGNYAQFEYYRLVSAGPDGKFGTKDDVDINRPNFNIWAEAQYWWLGDESRQGKRNQQARWNRGMWRRRALMMDERMEIRKAADGMALGRHLPPMAAQNGAFGGAKFKEDKQGGRGGGGGGPSGGGAGPPVKVREYFPETLKWEPAIITDSKGRADLVVGFADSITTWRLTASASSEGGALGSVSAPLRVFQDFFVDLDLPVSLTQNDEVAFPVAVYNYLKKPQTVRLELKKEAWFSLTDAGGYVRSLDLKPNEVTSVKFRIRANRIGYHPLEVKALGTKMSDAVKRSIEVVPDGKRIEQVVTDRLSGKVTQTIAIPPHALEDASKLVVKVYPGVMSQVLEGVEGMIRLPGG
jgi:hypothetical protein